MWAEWVSNLRRKEGVGPSKCYNVNALFYTINAKH